MLLGWRGLCSGHGVRDPLPFVWHGFQAPVPARLWSCGGHSSPASIRLQAQHFPSHDGVDPDWSGYSLPQSQLGMPQILP